MINLFVYGSLMYEAVWQQITHQKFEALDAVIHGYCCLGVQNHSYPGLVKGKQSIEGKLFLNISPSILFRLDEYEGDYYERISVDSTTTQQQRYKADVYLFKQEFQHLLSSHPWDRDYFEQHELKNYRVTFPAE